MNLLILIGLPVLIAVMVAAIVLRYPRGWLVRSGGRELFTKSEHEVIQFLYEAGVDLRDYNIAHGLICPPGGFPQHGQGGQDVYPDVTATDICGEYCKRLERGYSLLPQSFHGRGGIFAFAYGNYRKLKAVK